jgi:hypothetical protein
MAETIARNRFAMPARTSIVIALLISKFESVGGLSIYF